VCPLVLGYKGPDELEQFYETDNKRNIRAGLAPAFESQPRLIEGVDCLSVEGRPGLSILPGHIRLSEYEVTLSIAQELSASLPALQNLPGSVNYLLLRTAEKQEAEFVVVDMNPSLCSINQNLFSINQNLLMTSDFFVRRVRHYCPLLKNAECCYLTTLTSRSEWKTPDA
jgi:cellulose biosynthesis protein BcsQ